MQGLYTDIRWWVWSGRRVLDECDTGTGLVDVPDIEPLILLQTLFKLVWSVALGKDTLPGLIKPAME